MLSLLDRQISYFRVYELQGSDDFRGFPTQNSDIRISEKENVQIVRAKSQKRIRFERVKPIFQDEPKNLKTPKT